MITGLYAAIAGLMLIFLSVRVVGHRRGKKISVGTGGDAPLERAMRVQANFTEYVPLTLILMGIAELNGFPAFGVHAAGLVMLIARGLHFVGFSSDTGP